MKPSHIILALISCLFLLFSTAGCGPATPQANTPTAKPAVIPSPTITVRPTRTALPTATVGLPTPTIAPTADTPLTEPASLSADGPWFLLSKGTNYNGPTGVIEPVLINADGTAWEPLNVPRPADAGPEDYTWWFAEQVPDKPLILARGYFSEYSPDLACGKNHFPPESINPYEELLSIIKLPENEIIWQFPLLGAEAKAQIQKEDCLISEGNGIPSVLGVTRLPYRHQWFQNGRYLLFPAAPDGPAADFYIYDTETNNVRRLTSRQNNPEILGWSPDGQVLIYQGITKIDWYHQRVIESSGVYAVSISGTDRLLFKPEFVPWGIDWISSSQFLITDGYCDYPGTGECTARLLLVDLSTGASEVLYKNAKTWFSYYVTDPLRHTLLLIDPPANMPGAEVGKPKLDFIGEETGSVEGIFQYDFESRILHPVMLENLPNSVDWSREDQSFILGYDLHDENDHLYRTVKLMHFKSWQDYQLEVRDTINEAGVRYSPDKQWYIGKVGEENFIHDQKGHPFRKVMDYWGKWSPDSSSLIQILQEQDSPNDTWLYVYTRDTGWQNTATRHLPVGFIWRGMWIYANPLHK